MRRYEYEESDYIDDLDKVAFFAEMLSNLISKKKYLKMEERELLRIALDICVKLRSNLVKNG